MKNMNKQLDYKINKTNIFIKYIKCLKYLYNVMSVPTEFIIRINEYVEDKDEHLYIQLMKKEKEEIAEYLGISAMSVMQYISRCIDYGILFKTQYRGLFTLNEAFYLNNTNKVICFDKNKGNITIQSQE